MDAKARRPKGGDTTLSSLNMTIEALNLAKEICTITPAKAVFGSVSSLLTMVRVRPSQCDDELRVHVYYPGLYDQRTGLRRARVKLR